MSFGLRVGLGDCTIFENEMNRRNLPDLLSTANLHYNPRSQPPQTENTVMTSQSIRKTPSKHNMHYLTPRMLRWLQGDLQKFHDLFGGEKFGARLSEWQLEGLVVTAVQSDAESPCNAHSLQIKFGQTHGEELALPAHDLGPAGGDITGNIRGYLNASSADTVAVLYRRADSDSGRRHFYQICHIAKEVLDGFEAGGFAVDHRVTPGVQWVQTNAAGAKLSLRPSKNWRILRSIPRGLMEISDEFSIAA